MNDITPSVMQYRESARHLWNSVFQFIERGDNDFQAVDQALLQALVLNRAEPYINEEELSSTYFKSIFVIPEIAPKGSQAMFAFQSGNNSNWEVIKLFSAECSFNFMYFFDWKEWEYREFQYARARVLECDEHPKLVGADILLEAQFCTYARV